MKTKIFSFITLALTSLAFTSCDDNWGGETTVAQGELRLSSFAIEVTDAETIISRADVDLNPFIISVYKNNSELVEEWTYSRMPEIITLPVGSYSIKVRSHVQEKAAWEKPYFEGSESFSIQASKITSLGVIKCTAKALKVSVTYGETLKPLMGNDVEVTVEAGSGGQMVFSSTETRAAYFEIDQNNGDNNTLVATFKGTVNGYKENIRKQFDGVKPGEHYIISFKLRTNPLEPDPETGQIEPGEGITVETDIIHDDSQNGKVDNSEDLIDGDGIHDKEEFVEQVETKNDASSKTMTIAAPAGLASVTVKAAQDANPEFNAAFADLIAGIELVEVSRASNDYGLPTVAQGATSFTIGYATLYSMAQEYEGTHTFTFAATDLQDNSCDPVKVTVTGKSSSPGADAITFESKLSFDSPMDPADYEDEEDGKVTITAPAGIKNMILNISTTNEDFKGEVLDGMGLDGCDIANPSSDQKNYLDDLNLANGSDILNKSQVIFDISNFIPLLPNFIGTHKFTISVTDNDSNSNSITLTFVVE